MWENRGAGGCRLRRNEVVWSVAGERRDVELAHFRYQLHGTSPNYDVDERHTVVCIPYSRDALNRTRWVDAEFGTNLKVAYLDRVFVVWLPWNFRRTLCDIDRGTTGRYRFGR